MENIQTTRGSLYEILGMLTLMGIFILLMKYYRIYADPLWNLYGDPEF